MIIKKTVILFMSLMLLACSSMHRIYPSHDAFKSELRVGTVVTVTTKDGQTFYKKKISRVADKFFTVSGAEIPYQNVMEIEVSKFSSNKTAGLALLLFIMHQMSGFADKEPDVEYQ